ncbi:DegT/DnrJ/EryC1/StrS family aminotransferase [Actinopolymorpha singaporensis]|uniref:dTDP-4-amino-4,6-dideoxygalactose transaminase n=1 Tax=Actinopolymorpha singaporensis TaxID=117157 RepID=A0A1H1XUL0_9ACTN|nr:DegT/DnrJ/EryC1/StrS family aminotransferase [Actinopolymorpha singaporensis]SDT12968.1 dTDP-4-amino-4,6-dideoxygalactose transaminase [Actinopolymorpha singaporensis]
MASTLALRGGTPVRTRPFPSWPVAGQEVGAELLDVLDSGKWGSTHGERVAAFERDFAEYQQAAHCVCVSSGTLALVAGLRAAGVGIGDEVVVPPYTFIASAAAVVLVGAVPVFADVDPATHLLDPAAAAAAITPRTRAVMPVHIAGRPCDLDAFAAIGREHGVAIVEDAAQAHGAEWRGRRVGALGDLGTFSFQTSKNMSAGEGGAMVTNDDRLAERLYALANVGRVRGGGWYQHEYLGYNLRLTEFQAAILAGQLRDHPATQATRDANARLLGSLLGDVEGVLVAADDPNVTAHGRHLFLMRLPALGVAGKRDEFVQALAAEGVPCSGGYVGLHRNNALREEIAAITKRLDLPYDEPRVPGAEQVAADTVWLPQPALLGTEDDVRDIAAAVSKVLGQAHTL